MTFTDHVKNNVLVWLLGVLTIGFGAGFGAYETILRVSQSEVISKGSLDQLKSERDAAQSEVKTLRANLASNQGLNQVYPMPRQEEVLSPDQVWKARLACKDNDHELGIDFDTDRPVEISTFKEGSWYVTFRNTAQQSNLVMVQMWCKR